MGRPCFLASWFHRYLSFSSASTFFVAWVSPLACCSARYCSTGMFLTSEVLASATLSFFSRSSFSTLLDLRVRPIPRELPFSSVSRSRSSTSVCWVSSLASSTTVALLREISSMISSGVTLYLAAVFSMASLKASSFLATKVGSSADQWRA